MSFDDISIRSWALALVLTASGAASAAPVYATNPVSRDNFSYSFPFVPSFRSGQAVGSTGWHYDNVGGSGSVGIDGSHPHSGNGSVAFKGANSGSKADIEYLPGP